ncbi:MAG TPA: replication initiator [Dermatophilaceae bacterium]|nr:replication initiator [Dermatophilaceae bacterium]
MSVDMWSPAVQAQVADRLSRPDLGRWLGQVEQVRHCSHPVRLVGGSDTIHAGTGEVLGSYSSAAEPDGVTYVRCGNRRASVCPSCSHEYKGDVWHLLMAGAAGGIKNVPATVSRHPLVFATLTAPSFGLVHAAKKPGRPGSRRCHPRSGSRRELCPHGRPRWCMQVHDHTDPTTGQPLCADCYDYESHLVWQWWAPELWRRFTITLRRRLAAHLGLSETVARQRVRVQFAKVAEFQRRGIIHFHALIRLDGPPTDDDPYPAPSVEVTSQTLADLVTAAAGSVWCDAPPVDQADQVRRLRFGAQLDARPVTGSADRDTHGAQLHPETVAAYIAKYATKAAADLPTDQADRSDHLRRLKATLRDLAGRAAITAIAGTGTAEDDAYKGWSRWGDMFGFRGHLATKSRRYSTTLGRLRQARRDYTRRHMPTDSAGPVVHVGDDQDDAQEETTLVVGSWRFAGMGWLTAGDAALAAASAARARDD